MSAISEIRAAVGTKADSVARNAKNQIIVRRRYTKADSKTPAVAAAFAAELNSRLAEYGLGLHVKSFGETIKPHVRRESNSAIANSHLWARLGAARSGDGE